MRWSLNHARIPSVMRGGGGAFGRPSFGDLRDAEPDERISAGREGDDGGADPVRCLAQEGWALAGVLADRVAEGGNAAFGGLEREGDSQAGVIAQAGRNRVTRGLLRGKDREA